MKVLVLGGGVIGVSTAYYLARAGHEVELVDRQSGPALETSYANAGEVSPGYSAPWAGPGVPIKAIKWMLMQHSPLVIWPMLDPAMWRWGAAMLANCTERAYALNKSRMVPIAEYSRDCLKAAARRDRHRLRRPRPGHAAAVPHAGAAGRHRQGRGGAEAVRRALRGAGPRGLLPGRAGAGRTQEKFVGALRCRNDETGDCFKFTNRLAEMAPQLGREFRWNTRIDALTGTKAPASPACAPSR
jgi:D-amino-acid dehydrogenase